MRKSQLNGIVAQLNSEDSKWTLKQIIAAGGLLAFVIALVLKGDD
jgi:hypothetical protein